MGCLELLDVSDAVADRRSTSSFDGESVWMLIRVHADVLLPADRMVLGKGMR